jgi:hypothetical protein
MEPEPHYIATVMPPVLAGRLEIGFFKPNVQLGILI